MSDLETDQASKEAKGWLSIAADMEKKLTAAEVANERLRAVIIRYLDFAKDVAVSPVAPELKPIRDAMRAAVGYEQNQAEGK